MKMSNHPVYRYSFKDVYKIMYILWMTLVLKLTAMHMAAYL